METPPKTPPHTHKSLNFDPYAQLRSSEDFSNLYRSKHTSIPTGMRISTKTKTFTQKQNVDCWIGDLAKTKTPKQKNCTTTEQMYGIIVARHGSPRTTKSFTYSGIARASA